MGLELKDVLSKFEQAEFFDDQTGGPSAAWEGAIFAAGDFGLTQQQYKDVAESGQAVIDIFQEEAGFDLYEVPEFAEIAMMQPNPGELTAAKIGFVILGAELSDTSRFNSNGSHLLSRADSQFTLKDYDTDVAMNLARQLAVDNVDGPKPEATRDVPSAGFNASAPRP